MNLQELVQAVISNTNRPDLINETREAIKRATLKMHTVDHFARDLQLATINVRNPGYTAEIDLGHFPQFRRVAKIFTRCGVRLTPMMAAQLFSHERLSCDNYYYLRGNALVVKTSSTITGFNIDYLTYPIVNPLDSYNSWIANSVHEYAIVDEATVAIAAAIGDNNLAQQFRAYVGGRSLQDSHIHRLIQEEPLVSDIDIFEQGGM